MDVQPDMLGRFAYDAAVSTARDRRWNYDTQTVNGRYSIPTRVIPVRLVEAENAFLLEERLGQKSSGKGGQGGGSQSGGGGGGSGAGSSGGGGGSSAGSSGGGGGQQQKTRLIITTQDGKTMEMEIDGEIKTIEARPAGQGGGGSGGGGSSSGGSGGSGGAGGQGGGS